MKKHQLLIKDWENVSNNSRRTERAVTAADAVARFAAQCAMDKELQSKEYWREFIGSCKQLETGSRQMMNYRRQAEDLAQAGDHRRALRVLFHALAIDPWDAARYGEIGNTYYEMGEYVKAVKAYRRALMFNPKDSAYQYKLGTAHLLRDEPRQAVIAFAKTIKLNTEYSEAYDQLALIYRRYGYHDSAIEVLTRRIEICGDDTGSAYGALAHSLMYRNRYEEAAAAYRQAAQLARDNPDWRYDEGEALAKAGQYEEAISAYRQALEIAPNNMNPVIGIACAYDLMGDHEQGDRVIKRMGIILGDDSSSLESLADVIRSKADLYDFINSLLDDLKENPNEWNNLSLYAFLDALRGSLAEGYDDYYGVRTSPEFNWKAFGQVLLAARSYE